MLRALPLWPTLLGVNFWLIALLVPLALGRASASTLVWVTAPLGPLMLLAGLALRRQRLAHIALLVGVPLVVLLPTAEGPLAVGKLHPPAAVAVQLAVLLAYLASVCVELARDSSMEPAQPAAPASPPATWELSPCPPVTIAVRVRRRITTYRLLVGMCAAVPLLFLYAIDWYPENVRALRHALGSPARAAAMQAALTAVVTTIWSVLFHFFFMAPMGAHLDQDRELRGRLVALRDASRRGRPRLNLYIAIVVALVSMGLLLWWSL